MKPARFAEFDFLRHAIGVQMDNVAPDLSLFEGVRSDVVVALAVQHSVVPWLHDFVVKYMAPDQFPSDRLRRKYKVISLRKKLEREQCVEVSNLLKASNIPHAFVKGISISERVYRPIAQFRQSSDLDLIVEPENFRRVSRILQANRYRPDDAQLVGAYEQLIARRAAVIRSHEAVFQPEHFDKFKLDVHWRLVPAFMMPVSAETLLRHVDFLDIDGSDLPVLSVPYQLLHICVHSLNDRFFKLSQVVDMHLFARQFMCPEIRQLASSLGIGRQLDLAMTVTGDFFSLSSDDFASGRVNKPQHLILRQLERNAFKPYRMQKLNQWDSARRWEYFSHQSEMRSRLRSRLAPVLERLKYSDEMLRVWLHRRWPLWTWYPVGSLIRLAGWLRRR